jgi:hypothetical protein
VDGDEQQFVVRRRIGLQPLLVEQFTQPQVATVSEPAAFLTEVDVDPVPPPGYRFAAAGLSRSRWSRGRG